MYNVTEVLEYLNMHKQGYTTRRIYDDYYHPRHPEIPLNSFQSLLSRWKSKYMNADTETLLKGTYPAFKAHGATVQINSSGEIVQAWIKQHQDSSNIDELIETIRECTDPIIVPHNKEIYRGDCMLEVPFYDMHFPLSDYKHILDDLIGIIHSKEYDEINLIIGQDLFHNDDFRGRTTSGRPIERLDMRDAWKKAETFWCSVIYHALSKSNRVNLIYSKGNHDETLSWAFVQLLAARFPDMKVDDSLNSRKCIHWRKCFIGLTHGDSKKNSDSKSLRSLFTIEFPLEFADSSVREIHAGHLHHEEANDVYGITVRRLSSAVPTDEWSSNEGYVGAHKRFMIFDWRPEELYAIYFIS